MLSTFVVTLQAHASLAENFTDLGNYISVFQLGEEGNLPLLLLLWGTALNYVGDCLLKLSLGT